MRSTALLLFLLLCISITILDAAKKPKYCNERFNQMRDKVCRWPGEAKPCLQLHHSIKQRVSDKCCKTGCTLEELKEEICCFTDACLNRCYPGKRYTLGSVY